MILYISVMRSIGRSQLGSERTPYTLVSGGLQLPILHLVAVSYRSRFVKVQCQDTVDLNW